MENKKSDNYEISEIPTNDTNKIKELDNSINYEPNEDLIIIEFHSKLTAEN